MNVYLTHCCLDGVESLAADSELDVSLGLLLSSWLLSWEAYI